MRLCFETSGEHPTLPGAEIAATVGAVAGRKPSVTSDGLAIFASCPARASAGVVSRLALCHSVSEVLGEGVTVAGAGGIAPLKDISGKSVKVRATIVSGGWTKAQQGAAERKVGAVLAKRNDIDLRDPEIEVRIVLGSMARVCRLIGKIDRKGFEARKGENRPFFSPISLHPKYARALVNLSGVRPGGRLLDPFCGTGGILIEASLAGAKPMGSDLDPGMVDGSASNMAHFGLKPARLEKCDVSGITGFFGQVGAVATDPPYGRASSTGKEKPGLLHRRMLLAIRDVLVPGGRAAIVLPDTSVLKHLPDGLRMAESHPLRVHRSLVRHFVVLRKDG
ncbi:MAG: DNA modification methylase [Methanobacteriota archaeon]